MTSDLTEIVKQMKLRETKYKKLVLERINNEKTLTGKYIFVSSVFNSTIY